MTDFRFKVETLANESFPTQEVLVVEDVARDPVHCCIPRVLTYWNETSQKVFIRVIFNLLPEYPKIDVTVNPNDENVAQGDDALVVTFDFNGLDVLEVKADNEPTSDDHWYNVDIWFQLRKDRENVRGLEDGQTVRLFEYLRKSSNDPLSSLVF